MQPSQDELREAFEYQDGELIRKGGRRLLKRKPPKWKRRRINFNKNIYYLHRLVWIYHNGDIPEGMHIDHIDRNPSNNHIENLRLAEAHQNASNTIKPKNSSLCRGVVKNSSGKYEAYIRHKGDRLYIGSFKTNEEAGAAYDQKAIELKSEFAITNFK